MSESAASPPPLPRLKYRLSEPALLLATERRNMISVVCNRPPSGTARTTKVLVRTAYCARPKWVFNLQRVTMPSRNSLAGEGTMDNDTRFIYRCWQFHCVRASAYQTTLSQIRHKAPAAGCGRRWNG